MFSPTVLPKPDVIWRAINRGMSWIALLFQIACECPHTEVHLDFPEVTGIAGDREASFYSFGR